MVGDENDRHLRVVDTKRMKSVSRRIQIACALYILTYTLKGGQHAKLLCSKSIESALTDSILAQGVV